ncbi:hypothetical protein DYB34_007082 [Aphanomyces astaci]|uniref:Uncharacterized protein n=3 Tax=Aphanomyces astaci TaxID=112090 RepID=A0A418BCP6_APHAT|nr:hypothetical protein DYB34_007082 [Aphanomyces astaci]
MTSRSRSNSVDVSALLVVLTPSSVTKQQQADLEKVHLNADAHPDLRQETVALLQLASMFLPSLILNYHAEYFLLALHQDPVVAALAGTYSRVSVWCLPGFFLYELLKKVLQAQNIVHPMAYIAIVSNVVYGLLGYYMCYYTELSFLGAAYARTISNTLLPVFALIYLTWNPVYKVWWPVDHSVSSQWKAALAHVPEFFTLGIPGMLMMLMEWWAFEVCAVMAGWMEDPVLAISVQSVLMSLSAQAYSLFLGLSIATTVRLGNALGANEPHRAELISKVALGVALVAGAFVSLVFLVTHEYLPLIFISDPASIEATQHALAMFVVFELIDCMSCAAQSLLKGMGKQAIGTTGQIGSKNNIYCKKTPNMGTGASSSFLTDSKCELDVLLVASATGPGKEVKFYFQVNRTVPFVPYPVYEVPADPTSQLAEIETGFVGLVPSDFDILKIGRVDTISFVNGSILERKNFSDYGVETLLEPRRAISVTAKGSYKALGWFRVTDNTTNSTNEYIAIRDAVEIKDIKAISFPSMYIHMHPLHEKLPLKLVLFCSAFDAKTTYCWRVTNTTKFDGLTYDDQSFDSACPVSISVSSPRVAANLVTFGVAWTIKVVPNYVQNGGKSVYALGLSEDAANVAPILHTTLHFCSIDDAALCHMFSPNPFALSSPDLTGAFDGGRADFTAPGLTLTKGLYVGFVHGVVAKADGSLLHVATYVTIKVDEKQVKPPPEIAPLTQIANKTYCWKVFASASARNVSAASALGGYSVDDSCPLTVKVAIPSQVVTNSSVGVQALASASPVLPSVVTVATLPDGFVVSQATLAVCRRNASCGPFSSHPSLIDINITGPTSFIPTSLVLRKAGSYNVYLVVTVDVGKGVRLDVSVMASVQVIDPIPPVTNTKLYISIVGGVVGLAVVGVLVGCCIRHRRQRKAAWECHRLQRGTMSVYKESDPTPRGHSSIPMVNPRGGITEMPRLYMDENDDLGSSNPKLDLAVSHYMYNQDTRRVDELPPPPPRRVTSQYDPRTSLSYDVQDGYDEYHRQHEYSSSHRHHHRSDQDNPSRLPRTKSARQQQDNCRDHQLVLRDEYRYDQEPTGKHLAIKGRPHNFSDDDEFRFIPTNQSHESPSSLRNNYGGYDLSFSSAEDRPYYR